MIAAAGAHRLVGLESDNLLAFLALLGLLRALESGQPSWRPRARWDVESAPLRPMLVLHGQATQTEICDAASEGTAALAAQHDFGGRDDLNLTMAEARDTLMAARGGASHRAALCAALFSDVVVKKDKAQIEATPFCLLFGQGHQHFLGRLAAVPNLAAPPPRGRGKSAVTVTASTCLQEALFLPWSRQDPTSAFRWDPAEDVRYALLADDPSGAKTTTQHGANRLAAIGLATLTAVPIQRNGQVRIAVPGGTYEAGFRFTWPIWRDPASLSAIRALLGHPMLREPGALAYLGVVEVREARRISVGKFMNFTIGRDIPGRTGTAPQ
jgi:hypothetical protein